MEKECKQNLNYITDGFRKCRNAFTSIGDETQWKAIVELVNRVYGSVRHIISQSQGEDKL